MEEPKFISLAAAAKMTNYSQDYISLLCRQGKLKAQKLGRNWVTTKEWVYEYIDKTEGKGASIVPVKVKQSAEAAAPAGGRRPLFGSSILEMAVFCTLSVILLANTVGFSRGLKEVDSNFNLVQRAIALQNYIFSQLADKDDAEAISDVEATAQVCEAPESQKMVPFEPETDAAAIADAKKIIEADASEPVEVQVYKGFAIVSSQDNPDSRYLYMLNSK